jgi:3-epi-6-deoxocathasterone 23-monooxygenase
MVGKIVEERRKGMNFTDEKAPIIDAVDLLLRDSSESSETQRLPLDFISQHLLEMMVPGEETMPTATTLAVKFLSDNPVVLQNLMVRKYVLINQRLGLLL